jgi:hypothetical protein
MEWVLAHPEQPSLPHLEEVGLQLDQDPDEPFLRIGSEPF